MTLKLKYFSKNKNAIYIYIETTRHLSSSGSSYAFIGFKKKSKHNHFCWLEGASKVDLNRAYCDYMVGTFAAEGRLQMYYRNIRG